MAAIRSERGRHQEQRQPFDPPPFAQQVPCDRFEEAVETVGAGQNETMIRDYVDQTVVVLTPGMGDAVQMDKAGILEIADVFVCNKADHPGEDILVRDLREIAGKTPIFETVATHAQGIPELFDGVFAG